MPEGAESPGLPAAVDDVLPEFKVAFYPDTNFVRGGEYGLGAITPDNGQSGAAAPDPAEILTALAAPGRNPTDITIPTIGSEGSGGGDDDAIAGGPTSGSTGGSSSATQTAASENGSGTEVASAASSSGGAWVLDEREHRGVGLIRRVVGVECGRHELGGLCFGRNESLERQQRFYE